MTVEFGARISPSPAEPPQKTSVSMYCHIVSALYRITPVPWEGLPLVGANVERKVTPPSPGRALAFTFEVASRKRDRSGTKERLKSEFESPAGVQFKSTLGCQKEAVGCTVAGRIKGACSVSRVVVAE